jgi:phospholipid/cholesterol/gamma-HCH transport system permease protein
VGCAPATVGKAAFNQLPSGDLQIDLSGTWTIGEPIPDATELEAQLQAGKVTCVTFSAAEVSEWSSPLVSFLLRCHEVCSGRDVELELATLPDGLQRLLQLSIAVPEKKDARRPERKKSTLYVIGEETIKFCRSGYELLQFIGESAIAFGNLLRGRARLRWSDVTLTMQECGPEALPIVALINLLTGMIIGFVGAINLEKFGAAIFVADGVAIGMVREMGCLMTAIIVAGRTGASFAAELGTMKVNEEIDAFKTFGFSSIEYLVLPRMVALAVMMPVLCVFADLFGILGGMLVGVPILNLSLMEYVNQTVNAFTAVDFFIGVIKGSVFGVLIALTGCLNGINCGDNAAAVGVATTSAVVSGITSIIIADALFAVVFHILGV